MRAFIGFLVAALLSTAAGGRRAADHPRSAGSSGSGAPGGQTQPMPEATRKALLEAREAVWRSFFTGDTARLQMLLPAELVTIEPHTPGFGNLKGVLDASAELARSGAKLTHLEFPRTDIQSYGNTAIVYSTYVYELETKGKRERTAGRVTEVFVLVNGQWLNPGWHMDDRK